VLRGLKSEERGELSRLPSTAKEEEENGQQDQETQAAGPYEGAAPA
jgi:hypothetical protein